nr:hypothetical protein [Pseudomonas sp. HS-2]
MQPSAALLDLITDGEALIGRTHPRGLAGFPAYCIGRFTQAGTGLETPTGQSADPGTRERAQRPASCGTDHYTGYAACGLTGGVVVGNSDDFISTCHAAGNQQGCAQA